LPGVAARLTRAKLKRTVQPNGIGEIHFGMNEEALVSRFGRKNVTRDSLFTEGEFAALRSVVFGGTPREVVVYWREQAPPLNTIQQLSVRGSNSVYQFANGLRAGTTLAELARLNDGAPVSFWGMGWDYGGGLDGFGEGRLKKEIPCFNARFEMNMEENNQAEGHQLLGEKLIRSDTLTATQLAMVFIVEIYVVHL
jgi:hypothetical protein